MHPNELVERANIINRVATGEGDFQCAQCLRRFPSPGAVRKHKKKCPGAPGRFPYRTSRFKIRKIEK